MTREKTDAYISLLRFGRDHLEGGVQQNEIITHIEELGHKLGANHMLNLSHELFDYHDGYFVLSLDAYFQLLEYEELSEARKASTEAKRLAIAAIAISIVLAVFAIGLQQWGTSQVNLSEAQVESFVDAIRDRTEDSRR